MTAMGQSWANVSGTWGISSNQAYLAAGDSIAGGGQNVAAFDTGVSDATLSVRLSAAGDMGIAFRVTDGSNWYCANISGTTLSIFSVIGGSLTVVNSTTVSAAANGDFLIVKVAGTTYTAVLNGQSVSATDATFLTQTKGGLRVYYLSTTERFDDFSVGPISSTPLRPPLRRPAPFDPGVSRKKRNYRL